MPVFLESDKNVLTPELGLAGQECPVLLLAPGGRAGYKEGVGELLFCEFISANRR
ncbi:MAG: hypothetical protein ABSA26_16680 [Thermoguttaceae bacterium]